MNDPLADRKAVRDGGVEAGFGGDPIAERIQVLGSGRVERPAGDARFGECVSPSLMIGPLRIGKPVVVHDRGHVFGDAS